jgi:hypothetical protein
MYCLIPRIKEFKTIPEKDIIVIVLEGRYIFFNRT